MVYKLRSPARQFVYHSGYLYVILGDGSVWKYCDYNNDWELIAEFLPLEKELLNAD